MDKCGLVVAMGFSFPVDRRFQLVSMPMMAIVDACVVRLANKLLATRKAIRKVDTGFW